VSTVQENASPPDGSIGGRAGVFEISISPASCAARATNSSTFGPKAGGRSSSFRTALQGETT
jgi:hypothetical protein